MKGTYTRDVCIAQLGPAKYARLIKKHMRHAKEPKDIGILRAELELTKKQFHLTDEEIDNGPTI